MLQALPIEPFLHQIISSRVASSMAQLVTDRMSGRGNDAIEVPLADMFKERSLEHEGVCFTTTWATQLANLMVGSCGER